MRTLLTSITLATLLFLAVCGSASWLLYSEAGTTWLLSRLAESQGGRIGQIEGTLIGRLHLTDVAIDQSERGVVTCENLELQTQIGFYPPHLTVKRLGISNLDIDNRSTSSPRQVPEFSWPQLPGWLKLIEIDLLEVDLANIQVHSQTSEGLRINQLRGRIQWRDQNLTVADLLLTSPQFELSGNVHSGFAHPALQVELSVTNRQTQQPWQQVELSGDLALNKSEQLRGPFKIVLDDRLGPRFSVDGDIGLTEKNIQFEQVRFTSTRRGGRIQADGSFNFVRSNSGLSSRLQIRDLELDPEFGRPMRLSGTIDLNGFLNNYQGRFSLTSRAQKPLSVKLSGQFSGNLEQLLLTELNGEVLGGTLAGELSANWQTNLQLRARLVGRELKAQQLYKQLNGSLNCTLDAELNKTEEGPVGQLNLRLDNSLLHGQMLSGNTSITFNNKHVEISELNLNGAGFQLEGQGSLDEKFNLTWQIENLEQLLNDWNGRLAGSGWLQITPGGLSADFSSSGNNLQFKSIFLNSWQLEGNIRSSQKWQVALTGQGLRTPNPEAAIDHFRLTSDGHLTAHQVDFNLEQPGRNWRGLFIGGWDGEQWQGHLDQFKLSDTQFGQWQAMEPTAVLLSREFLQLNRLPLENGEQENIFLQGRYLLQSKQAEGQIEWSAFDLDRLSPWLKNLVVSGTSDGRVSVKMLDSPELQGHVELQGRLQTKQQTLHLLHGDWQAEWSEQGLNSGLAIKLADGSQLDLKLSSDEPFAATRPRKISFSLDGENISLKRAQPWLPEGLNLSGKLYLKTNGLWLADQAGQLTGSAEIVDGQLFWQEDEDIIRADINNGYLSWDWRERLNGQFELQLEERGNIDANLTLPVAATWPIHVGNHLPVSGNMSARLQELGLFSILFPKQVQDSSGQLKLELQLGGIWQEPLLQGEAYLFDAKAFLPQPGLQLNSIEIATRMNGQQLTIDRVQVHSGEGSLFGQGAVLLTRWRPQEYHLELNGKNFQLINLPELQGQVSPAITIDGDLRTYRLAGHLTVPQFLFSSKKNTGLAQRSQDVIVVDAPDTAPKQRRLKPEIDLQLHLGEQVLVKSTGLDARLEGDLRLGSTPQGAVAAYGDIRVAKGRYASYGINLDITRGDLFFNGGPIEQPVMDILALRTVGEVQAGVKVTGTPKQPVVQLYSEPGMAETDILSYIVLGRPVGAERNENDMLMTAAGALLSQGESVVLQEKLKKKLGLDVLDINAGNGDVSSSIITTGKYLNPDLYISLGYSLFDNSNEVKLRYNLSPRWEIESNIGTESGVDLFYKIDIP